MKGSSWKARLGLISMGVWGSMVLSGSPVHALPILLVSREIELEVHRPATGVQNWSGRAQTELGEVDLGSERHPAVSADSSVAITPATVRAQVSPIRPAIERTSLRTAVLVEAYKPSGVGGTGAGGEINYGALPSGPLVQIDLRWLPLERGAWTAGGYGAVGYSRHELPLIAASGFRYEDVTLNVMRSEVGGAVGLALRESTIAELRLGLGQLSHIQASRYSEFNGTSERSYASVAIDLSYHFVPRVAAVMSGSYRAPLGAGSGGIDIQPLTVSGGLLVQLR